MSIEHSVRDDVALALGSDYEIVRELGRGGASVVYLGRDRVLGREVAIKVIRDSHAGDAEAVARFEREARMLASLQHPNIVMLYAAKQLPGGTLALVMQHGGWATLKSVILEKGALPLELVERVLRDVASALDYLHRHNVIHRDVKPENIFIDGDSGRALLSDFSIAKSGDAATSVTLTGVVIGTPAYMSPEQIDGGELTGRSDLYSLGMVGYEMLTGERPWEGENLFNVIYKQKTERLPSLLARRPDTPEKLRRLIEKATEKDPALRWSDASEFLAALGGSAPSSLPIPVPPQPVAPGPASSLPLSEYPTLEIEQIVVEEALAQRARKPRRRRRFMAAAVVVLLFSGGAGALAFSGRSLDGETVFDLRTLRDAADETSSLSLPPATREAQPAAVDTPSFALVEPIVDSDPPPPDTATQRVTQPEEPPARPRNVAQGQEEPARSPSSARPPPTAENSAVPAGEEGEAELPTTPPALLPSLNVTVPTDTAPSVTPSRVLQPLEARTSESPAPQLQNRDLVGQLLRERYPTDLRRRGVGGTTVLTVLVSPEGSVERSNVVSSSGNERLDEAAQRVAERMVFRFPEGTTPKAVWVAVPLTFDPR